MQEKNVGNIEDKNWYFVYLVNELQEDNNKIVKFHNIMPMCRESYISDKQAILEYNKSLQLITLVQLNIQDLLQAISHCKNNFLQSRKVDEDELDQMQINFQRLILNLLSMFRSLIDHSDISISREFGKDSEELKEWKSILSHHYETSFEYRFFYTLRNYSQHIGMPPIEIVCSDNIDTEKIYFRLYISRDSLLEENRFWNKKLITDLEHCSEKISVIDCLLNWKEIFRDIANNLLRLKRKNSLKSAKKFLKFRELIYIPKEAKLALMYFTSTEEKSKEINFIIDWFPEKQARSIIEGDNSF